MLSLISIILLPKILFTMWERFFWFVNRPKKSFIRLAAAVHVAVATTALAIPRVVRVAVALVVHANDKGTAHFKNLR